MAEKGTIVIPITLMFEGENGAVSNAVEGGGDTASANDSDKAQKKAEERAKSNANAAKAIISRVASQTASLAMQGYGDITGNYVEAQNLQVAVTEAGKIAGAISLGWVGAALYVVDKGVQAFNYVSDLKKSERQAAFAQKRVYGTTRKG
jgi:hypothetical protein